MRNTSASRCVKKLTAPHDHDHMSMLRIRASLVTFQRYSSSLPLSFNINELQDRVKRIGVDLHCPEDGVPIRPRTLALLVGWAESRQRAVAKFASLYTKQGIPCLTVASRIWTMWFTSLGNKLTNQLIASLDSATPPDEAPIDLVLHIFSGGGSIVYPKLVEDFKEPSGILRTKVRPKCVIFDSGPSKFSQESGIAAARLVYKQGGFNFPMYVASLVVGSTTDFFIGSRKRSELTSALESPLLDVPQLYLYSKADSVCRSRWVEQVMEEQRRRGREVESYQWEDSEHVRHFIQYPEQYEKLLSEYLSRHLR